MLSEKGALEGLVGHAGNALVEGDELDVEPFAHQELRQIPAATK